jgi:NAD(P)-dependent dehydrogenase (short-subunit alcohol dehydrogenase family)
MARLVVVTGGAKGVGREISLRFAAQGERVLVLARDAAAFATLPEIECVVCDVTDEASVVSALEGRDVDVLVNNAGVADSAPLHRTTLASWQHQLAVSATGAFLCTRAVIEGMRRRGDGRIVTVASTAGLRGAPYIAAYAAAKHASIGLMRATAAELAGSGVTANAVCPTYIDTEMTRRSIERIAAASGRDPADAERALLERTPLRRLLSVGEVAAAVLWLASADAATISGETLVLDGGGITL